MKKKPMLRLRLRFGPLKSQADGRAFAVKVATKLDTYATDDTVEALWPWSIQAMYRPEGTQQDNVLLRCIDALQKRGSREALIGFCAVMTDYLCSVGSAGAGTPNLGYYESLTERDMTGKPGPWPSMDDEDEVFQQQKAAREDVQLQTMLQRLQPGA